MSSQLKIEGGYYQLEPDLPSLAAAIAANSSSSFALAKDYDASVNGTYSNSPLGALSGSFEGLGHTISNVTISTYADYIGFFSYLQSSLDSRVADFTLANIHVTGLYGAQHIGGLAGYSTAVISNVRLTGSVSAGDQSVVGGLIARDEGSNISNVSVHAKVAAGAQSIVGGFAATSAGYIETSSASGTVTGEHGSYAGGFIGQAKGRYVNDRSTASVHGADYAGGLFGSIDGGTISGSFAGGKVSAHRYGGGLVGRNAGRVTDCYATGAVSGGKSAGGLAGDNDNSGTGGTIATSYAIGAVSANTRAGGVIGSDVSPNANANVYWDFDTSGIADPAQGAGNIANDPGLTGLTDAQLKAALPAGFNGGAWRQNAGINNGYPYLMANPPQ